MSPYLFNGLVALDQAANAWFLRGKPDETISARAYREQRWRLVRFIDWVFRDKTHCRDSYISEVNRSQLPQSYRVGVPNA